ncbi:MAG: helicase-exonuclease AddAB subunit AddA [Clostridiales bacterium]|nr:helicase-exonuclease AddAB subunit AddA [Clostridiales bacterium]
MTRWTEEQEDAVYKRKANILVSAAAGSGKTAVLTERILELIEEEELDISQLLVFTFSRAAANEMKERVYKKIIERLKKKGFEEFYRKQLMKINQAKITTIHSFCNEVVKSNFFAIGIDPDYRIGEDNDFNLIKDMILEEVFEEYYEMQDILFEDLVEVFGDQRGDKKLREIIHLLHRKMQSYPDVKEWFNKILCQYQDIGFWNEELNQYLMSQIEQCVRAADELWKVVENESGSNVYEKFFRNEISQINQLYFNLKDKIFDTLVVFNRLPSDKEVDQTTKGKIQEIRNFYKGIITGIQKDYFIERTVKKHSEEFLSQLPRIEKIIEIVKEFDNRLLKYKKKNNILEFNDLEHFTLEILEDPNVSKIYQQQFKYIFVDEYQDSNYIQEAIIQKIKNDENLFMVGDLKQSIYKFRLAEPTIFLNKYKRFSKEKNPGNHKIDLNKNFRSRENILNFINYLFHDFMSEDFGGMNYDTGSRLYNGKKDFDGVDLPVEINLLKVSPGELSKEIIEIHEISNRIKSLVKEQNVQYKDIVVLMRSPSSYIEDFSRIFISEGIPLFIESTDEYIDTLEVDLIRNYLKVIDNTRQDIPLVSLMRSPIYNFSDDELYQIRDGCQNEFFHECIFKYDGQVELKNKINRFVSDINDMREFSRFMTIDNMIWTIFTLYHFQEFFTALTKGDQRSANVRKLMDIASEYQSNGIVGLADFNHYMDYLQEKEAKFSSAKIISDQANVVRLMSIHKSKGLEFPIVILAGTGKKFNKRDTYGDMIVHNKYGIIPKYFDKENRIRRSTFHRDIVTDKMSMESSEEELRILYVALTRAVDQLLIFATIQSKSFDKTYDAWDGQLNFKGIEKNERFIEWIMFNMYNQKSIDKPSYEVKIIETKSENYEKEKIDISSFSQKDFITYIEKNVALDGAEIEIPDYIERKIDKLQSKVTVTDIAHNRLNLNDDVEITEPMVVFSDKKKENAAQTGIEIHRIMQMVKLDQLNDYLTFNKQVEEMIRRNLISKEIYEKYDLNKIYNFFESELGKRMIKSINVKREEPFIINVEIEEIDGMIGEGNMLIQGIIDCYFIENDEVVLIDFKSDNVNEDNYQKSLLQYTKQLRYYSLAIESLLGKKVKEKIIHFFNINKSIEIS